MTEGKSEFFVVAVGASAGGLEALEDFFDNLPADRNYALVVIQHLSPDFKSLMAEILEKHTAMPIRPVTDGMMVEPGGIYLIPRKSNLTMFGGKLYLRDQEQGLNLPIDRFMESLAEDCGDRAVGIVLSGTGSDGTRGVRAIKERGGLVMVQEAASAKFDGMPRSAIATGIVDLVLPPARLAEELHNFVSGIPPRLTEPLSPDSPADDALGRIFFLIKQRVGVDLSYYKETTVLRRLERRMGVNQIADLDAYVQFLEEFPQEVVTLFKEILIGVTRFFRDDEAFAAVEVDVVPSLFDGKAAEDEIRVWVPGCSTGEEAYSLAILLAEYRKRMGLSNEIKVFATDIDRDALEFASYGTYPESVVADINSERLQQWFVRREDRYQVSPPIREMVIFAYHNLFQDPPFRRMDLVSCRNLLIYLQPVLQKRVLSNFHFSLARGGFLILGSSETVGPDNRQFRSVNVKWKLFQANPGPGAVSTGERARFEYRSKGGSSGQLTRARAIRQTERLYERVIEGLGNPCVIVNESREVQHVFGDVTPYLRLPKGRIDLDVLRMARGDLSISIGAGIQEAARSRARVHYQGVRADDSAGGARINLEVVPVEGVFESLYYAVVFRAEPAMGLTPVDAGDLDDATRERIRSLEAELQHSRENLQATIEELETSNEELQATNEELVSSNEELQSTNEELQSVNEELVTVNSEYQRKIEQLQELHEDMNNLIAGAEVGTIFLDADLLIRRFTPAAAHYFRIIDSDIGRPIQDLTHSLQYSRLLEDVRRVLATRQEIGAEARTGDGRWVQLKVLPYRSISDGVSGAVVTLIDVTPRRNAELALARQNDLMMSILEGTPSGVVMVGGRGQIVYANKEGERLLGLNRSELQGRTYDDPDFGIESEDGASIDPADLPFARVQRTGDTVRGYRHYVTRGDRRVLLEISGSPVITEDGSVDGAIFSIQSVDSES